MDPFWLEYTDSLYRYAVRLTGDRDEARDLVQETFLRFIGKGRVPRPDANVKAYLFTVLRHLWYRERRRQRDRRRVLLRLFRRYPVEGGEPEGLSEVPEATWSDPELQALREADTHLVRTALTALPLPFREVLLLREVEGFPYQDIARILGVPMGTVMSRLHRARALLKRTLVDLQASRRETSDGVRSVASSDPALH
jgi:RNA polymerase sigma-70 factor (ECF subfamily)